MVYIIGKCHHLCLYCSHSPPRHQTLNARTHNCVVCRVRQMHFTANTQQHLVVKTRLGSTPVLFTQSAATKWTEGLTGTKRSVLIVLEVFIRMRTFLNPSLWSIFWAVILRSTQNMNDCHHERSHLNWWCAAQSTKTFESMVTMWACVIISSAIERMHDKGQEH